MELLIHTTDVNEIRVLGVSCVAGPVLAHHSNLRMRKVQVRHITGFVQGLTRKTESELGKVTHK